MNSNQIHIYEDYAICPYNKPNSNDFIPGALRVKVTKITSEDAFEGARRTTNYVEGFSCDSETGDVLSNTLVKHRTRDVISDWDEYEDARDLYEIQENKRRAEIDARNQQRELERQQREREYQERMRIQRIERERKEIERRQQIDKMNDSLAAVGIFEAVTDPDSDKVTVSFKSLRDWLDSLERSKCEICHKDKVVIPSGTQFKKFEVEAQKTNGW